MIPAVVLGWLFLAVVALCKADVLCAEDGQEARQPASDEPEAEWPSGMISRSYSKERLEPGMVFDLQPGSVFHQADLDPVEVIHGTYDPCRKPLLEPSFKLVMPEGLRSVEFAHPSPLGQEAGGGSPIASAHLSTSSILREIRSEFLSQYRSPQ